MDLHHGGSHPAVDVGYLAAAPGREGLPRLCTGRDRRIRAVPRTADERWLREAAGYLRLLIQPIGYSPGPARLAAPDLGYARAISRRDEPCPSAPPSVRFTCRAPLGASSLDVTDGLQAFARARASVEEYAMIILGIVLLVIGFLTKIAILWTIGIIVAVIGLILLVLGLTGRAVGGRKHWY